MFVSLCRESARERTEVSTPVHKKDRHRDRVTERDREGKGGQRRWRDSVYVHVYFCVSLDLSLFLARTLSRACTLSLSLPRCLAASLPRCLAASLPRSHKLTQAHTSSLVSVLSLPPSPSYSPVSRSVALTLVQSCPRTCMLECRAVLIECKTLQVDIGLFWKHTHFHILTLFLVLLLLQSAMHTQPLHFADKRASARTASLSA